MVGSRFCELTNLELIKADLNGDIKVDITDKNSLETFFSNLHFQTVVLFSAFTDVDKAEHQRNDKKGIAWKINVDGLKNVVDKCSEFNKKLIFISTDFVFDGASGPYDEKAESGSNQEKISWYGITKIMGEQEIEKRLDDYLILRIAYPYRGYFPEKDDFAKQIFKHYLNGTLYPMFDDQKITPTYVDDLAPAIELLLEKQETGIWHLASPKVTTPYDFACELLNAFGQDAKNIQRGSILDFMKRGNVTPRPVNGGFIVDKLSNLGFTPTSFESGIKKLYAQTGGKLI